MVTCFKGLKLLMAEKFIPDLKLLTMNIPTTTSEVLIQLNISTHQLKNQAQDLMKNSLNFSSRALIHTYKVLWILTSWLELILKTFMINTYNMLFQNGTNMKNMQPKKSTLLQNSQ